LANGGNVFAGHRDESFYIDLGATFDTLNLRGQPPTLTADEDKRDDGPDRYRQCAAQVSVAAANGDMREKRLR